jgi:hypothetical protein
MKDSVIVVGIFVVRCSGDEMANFHTVFVVFSLSMSKPVLTTPYLTKAKAYIEERLSREWSFGGGRYYCPYVIYDCYITTDEEEDEPSEL